MAILISFGVWFFLIILLMRRFKRAKVVRIFGLFQTGRNFDENFDSKVWISNHSAQNPIIILNFEKCLLITN